MDYPERLLQTHAYLVGKSIAALGLSGDPEVEDLEQEARLALLKAAHEFDPDAGHKFSSFAIPRVRGSILEYRRSRCSWVRRTGQKARARVDVAVVALELRGEEPTPETIRALLEDPRDYDRAAALPVAFPLYWQGEGGGDDWTMRFSLENLAAGGPEVLEVVWSRENEALIERAIKRLCAVDRAVFRGRVQRDMKAREVASVLDIPPAEVTRRLNKTLALVRRYLDRVAARFTQKRVGINVQTNPTCHWGRKPMAEDAKLSERFWLRIDRERRQRAMRLAYQMNISVGEVARRGIDCLWEREMDSGGTLAPGQK